MQISELTMATPYYVLIDQKTPLCTHVADSSLGVEHSAIFGFSDKTTYDKFSRDSSIPLRPYPLVKGYLQTQLDNSVEENADELSIKLVILDAPGPRAVNVYAATMKAVLVARESGLKQIAATHHLTFDPAADAYRMDEALA